MVRPRIKGNEPEQTVEQEAPGPLSGGGEGAAAPPVTQQTPEPDPNALLEQERKNNQELKERLAQRESENAGLRGTVQQRYDSQAEMSSLRRQIKRSNDLMELMFQHLVGPENEPARQQIDQMRQRQQQDDAQDALTKQAKDAWDDLLEAAQEAGLDRNQLSVAPEWEEVRLAWNRGYVGQQVVDVSALREAVRTAKTIRRQAQRSRDEQQRKQAEEAKKEQVREGPGANSPVARAAPGPRGYRNQEELRDAFLTGKINRDKYLELKPQLQE